MPVVTFSHENLSFVSNSLRVPEYRYAHIEESEAAGLLKDTWAYLAEATSEPAKSLLELRLKRYPDKTYPDRFLNLMFVVDRCMDVWLRKNSFDPVLRNVISHLRSSLLRACYEGDEALIRKMIELVDLIAEMFTGWCENPERTKAQVPGMLISIIRQILTSPLEVAIQVARTNLETYRDESAQRAEKISSRLLATEQNLIAADFAQNYARQQVNGVFADAPLAASAQGFVAEYWLAVWARYGREVFDNQLDSEKEESLNLLAKKVRAVFGTQQGKAAMQYGDTLIDELIEACRQCEVRVPSESWEALSQDVICVLKGEELALTPCPKLSIDDECLMSQTPPSVGDWFINHETGFREQVMSIFEQANVALFVNHLGMKMGVVSLEALAAKVSEKKMQKYVRGDSFEKVLETNLKGLTKVATTQEQARIKAAAKAKEEAERIRSEQEAAKQLAQRKAQEIAKRTREMALKKEEAERIEKESAVLGQLAELNLGAWIAVNDSEGKHRFKLAVKFAAKKRYVFVDKYGIKKLEFDEEGLVQKITDGTVELLNDGANFDDSLERVIGRIRMAK